MALSTRDGSLLWRAGSRLNDDEPVPADDGAEDDTADDDAAPLPPGADLAGVYFMGVPQSFGRWRLVIAQKRQAVMLLALDAQDGSLGWSVPLGRSVRTLGEDVSRHGQACPVTLFDGKAYCPTAAGCFACVDVHARRLLWALRLPRDNLPRSGQSEALFRPDAIHSANLPTREQWHATVVHASPEGLVLATPDSDWLYGLDVRTGQIRWRQARDGGLIAAGLDDQRVLVLSASKAIARNVSNGEVLWSVDIDRPAGTGFLSDSDYLFPTATGGVQRVRIVDGHAVADRPLSTRSEYAAVGKGQFAISYDPPSRLRPVMMCNLVAAGDVVLLQSFDELAAIDPQGTIGNGSFSTPSPVPAAIVSGHGPDNADPQWNALLTGVRELAVRRGEFPLTRPLRRLMPFAVPSIGVVHSAATAWLELIPLMRSPEERAAALLTQLSAGVESSGPQSNAMVVLPALEGLSRLPIDRLFVSLDAGQRSVRLDCWLKYGFAEAAAQDAERRQQIDTLLQERLASLATTYRQTVVASSDTRGLTRETEPSDVLAFDWPAGNPTVTEQPPRSSNLYVNNVPLTVISDSPWEQVTVQVDRLERGLLFQRADLSQPVTMSLTRSTGSPETTGRLAHAWAHGPLLIVRISTDLYGFWLPEGNGALPHAPLWPAAGKSHQITGDRPPLFIGLVEASDGPRPLWDDSIPRFYDNFSRPLGIVGPVGTTCFCYQDRGNLVALDPTTGRELWCRAGLPVGTFCVGDDHHIVLLRDDERKIEVLRSRDGATESRWDWSAMPDAESSSPALFSHIVAVRGTRALWHSHPPQVESFDVADAGAGQARDESSLALIDLTTGRQLWSGAAPPGSWAFDIDPHQFAILTPQGNIALRDWENGETVATLTVEVPSKVRSLYVLPDATSAIVVASDRPNDRGLLGATQIRGGERRPSVNGWMSCIDRRKGRLDWTRAVDNVGLILDQPKHVPLLVTAYMIQDERRNQPSPVLECFDRRTGDLIYEHVGGHHLYLYHAVRADAAHAAAEVEIKDRTIRFQYPPAP
ncbi:MAG: PQQ-binding-like beta-propeller repeat protein [Planctomycetaceae bacterium]|nr:PQQ-binding-like beta-propeller repeat protein [Planctomycetaceae bacterium]